MTAGVTASDDRPEGGRRTVHLATVAESWFASRTNVKRRTRETDAMNWRAHIEPRFGCRAISTLTTSQISKWVATLVHEGRAPSTAERALSTLRSILAHAVADDLVSTNVAAAALVPTGARPRETQTLSTDEVDALAAAAVRPYSSLIVVLAHTGMRWGELAGLQVGDVISFPRPALELQRSVLASTGSGELFVDALRSRRVRIVDLSSRAAEIVQAWAGERPPHDWLFPSPTGTALREGNWKRTVGWTDAKRAVGHPTLRVDDLRNTAIDPSVGRARPLH